MHRDILQLVALRLPNKSAFNLLAMGFTPDDSFWKQKLQRTVSKIPMTKNDDFYSVYKDLTTYTYGLVHDKLIRKKKSLTLRTSIHDYENINTLPVLKYMTSLNPDHLNSYANIHSIIAHALEIKSEDIFTWILNFEHNIYFIIEKLLYEGTLAMIKTYYVKYTDKFELLLREQDDAANGIIYERDSSDHSDSEEGDEYYYHSSRMEDVIAENYLSFVTERIDAVPILEFIYEKTQLLPHKSLYNNSSIEMKNEKTYAWLLEHKVVPENGRINYALLDFSRDFARNLMLTYKENPTPKVFSFLYYKIDIALLDFLFIEVSLKPEIIRNYFSPKIMEEEKLKLLDWAFDHKVKIDPKIFYAVLLEYEEKAEAQLLNWFLTHGYSLDQNLMDVILSQSLSWKKFPLNKYKASLNAVILAFNNENYSILPEIKKLFPDVYTAFIKLVPTNDPAFYYFDKSGDPRKRKVPLKGYKPKNIPLQQFPASPLLEYLQPILLSENSSKWRILDDPKFRSY